MGTIDEERAVFEAKLQKLTDEANRKLELRTRELERTKDLRREECDAAEKKERDEEGAASSATLAKHRDILDSIDQEIEGARGAVENKWQNDAARWLSTGRRKVELKKRED